MVCISDPLRPEAEAVIRQLRGLGIRRAVMLTGDSGRTAAAIAAEVKVDEYHAEILPAEHDESAGTKLKCVRKPTPYCKCGAGFPYAVSSVSKDNFRQRLMALIDTLGNFLTGRQKCNISIIVHLKIAVLLCIG